MNFSPCVAPCAVIYSQSMKNLASQKTCYWIMPMQAVSSTSEVENVKCQIICRL